MPHRSSTNSVQKVCRVLRALSDPRTRRLTDIANATGINKVSVLRIAEALVKEGLIERAPEGKEFRLSPEVQVLAQAAHGHRDLDVAARPSLLRLAEVTGDTVLLLIRSGTSEAVCMARETGSFPIHTSTLFVGSRRPLGIGSGPMAILASLEDEEVASVLEQIKPRLKAYEAFSIPFLRKQVTDTRKRGYSLQLNVLINQTGAIGRPIFGPDNRLLGALSIASLSERIRAREARLAQWLTREVSAIQNALRNPKATRAHAGTEVGVHQRAV
jgi:DNA-binding IclR family transcriptional regulator